MHFPRFSKNQKRLFRQGWQSAKKYGNQVASFANKQGPRVNIGTGRMLDSFGDVFAPMPAPQPKKARPMPSSHFLDDYAAARKKGLSVHDSDRYARRMRKHRSNRNNFDFKLF